MSSVQVKRDGVVHLDVRCDISEQYVFESVMRRRKVQAGVKCNISGQKTRSRGKCIRG